VGGKSGQARAWEQDTAANCNTGSSSPQRTPSTLPVRARVDWRLLMLGRLGGAAPACNPNYILVKCAVCITGTCLLTERHNSACSISSVREAPRVDIVPTLHCHATWSVHKHEVTRINTAPSHKTAPVCPKQITRQLNGSTFKIAATIWLWVTQAH
jgi:hypothetical protein